MQTEQAVSKGRVWAGRNHQRPAGIVSTRRRRDEVSQTCTGHRSNCPTWLFRERHYSDWDRLSGLYYSLPDSKNFCAGRNLADWLSGWCCRDARARE